MRRARKALRARLRAFFADAAHEAGQQIAPVLHALTKDAPPPDDVRRLLDALHFATWTSLEPDVERLLVLIAEDGAEQALRQIGVAMMPAITAQVHEAAVAFARERGAELVGMRWEGNILVPNPNAEWAITDATRELLRADLTDALTEGWGTDELIDHLSETYAFSDARAEMIARTELARADVEGNLAGWRASGEVSGKRWLLSDLHDVPDECDEADAMGVVDLDDDFGGIGDPPAHPNCECDIEPVLAEDDGA